MVVKELVALLGFKVDESSQKKAEGGLSNLASLAAKAAAAFAAIKVAAFAKNAVVEIANLGDRFDKMAKRTGIAAGELQGLEHAAELSGASLGALETAFKKLQASQVEAADGTAEYLDEFKRMGVEVKNADGSLKSTTDLFVEMADGIKNLDTDAEKTAVAVKLLGRSGQQLIPMFAGGADAMREMMMEMEALGGVIENDMVQASADYIDNQRRMEVVTRGVKLAIAKELLPAINNLSTAFIEWWKVNGAVMRQRIGIFFGTLGRVVLRVAGLVGKLFRAVFDLFEKLSPLQKKIVAVTIALGALFAVIQLGTWGKFALVLGAILLILEDFATYADGGNSAFERLLKKVYEFLGIDADTSFQQWSTDMKQFGDGAASIFSGLVGGMVESLANMDSAWSALMWGTEEDWSASLARQREIWDQYLPAISHGLDVLFGVDFPASFDEMVELWNSTLQGVEDFFFDKLNAMAMKMEGWKALVLGWVAEVKAAMLDMLPDWLKNIISGKGGAAGSKAGASPVVEGAMSLIGRVGAEAASPAAIAGGSVTSSTSSSSVVNAPKTDIKIEVKASPGMNEKTLANEVGRVMQKTIERENRAAMRALVPARPPMV